MNPIFAFIVGIEKYDQPDWDVPGPCANAIAMANWLLSVQVPAENIFLFLDAVQNLENEISRLGADGVQVRRSGRWDTLDTFWRQELAQGRPADSCLLVYWSGHGFTENDGWRVFICRDYLADRLNNRVFSASSFLRYLRSPDFQCFREQIFLADVCAVYTGLDLDAGRRPPKSVVAAAKQVAYFATPEGRYAQGNHGRGVFTETALAVLKRFHNWPELKTFGQRMDAAFENVGQTPFRIAVFNDETEIQDRLVGSVAGHAGSMLFHAVWSLLSSIPIPDAVYRPHYLRTVNDLGNPKLARAQGLVGMIHELTSLCDAYGLLQFLVRLTQEDGLKEPANAWLASQAADQAHSLATLRQKLEAESRQKILIVEVMVDARGGIASFELSLRRQNLAPVPDSRFNPQAVNDWDEFEGKLQSLIEKLRSKHSIDQIHFLADPPLFDRPFHRILTADGTPLGEIFVVVVRHRERLRNATPVIRKLWNDYAEALRCSQPREVKLVPVWCPGGESGQPASDEKGLCYARFAVPPATQGGSAGITEEKKRLLKLLRLGVPYLYWPHRTPPAEHWDQIEEQLTAWLENLKTLDQFPNTFTEARAYEKELATQATLLWDDPQFHPFLSPRGIELR